MPTDTTGRNLPAEARDLAARIRPANTLVDRDTAIAANLLVELADALTDERALTDDQRTALAVAIRERDETLGRYAVAVANQRAAEQAEAVVRERLAGLVTGSVSHTDGLTDEETDRGE